MQTLRGVGRSFGLLSASSSVVRVSDKQSKSPGFNPSWVLIFQDSNDSVNEASSVSTFNIFIFTHVLCH